MHTLLLLILLILGACGDPCAESVDQTFLDHEADQDGAIRTESGLIYRDLKEGWGPQPGPKSRVTIHYKGMLPDGTVFDSSYERGHPSTLSLKRVISGWTEGLQMMKGGAEARLVIPPNLAYGKKGSKDKIPPCSTLIFEIKLYEIKGS